MTERIATLRTAPYKPRNKGDAEKAERRLQRWRSQPPFSEDLPFAQRLATAGITEDDFRELLGEPIEAVRDRLPPPKWLSEFAEAFSRAADSGPVSLSEALRGKEMDSFLHAIRPLINEARERLHEGVASLNRQHTSVPFDLDTIEDVLCASLPQQLLWMMGRTLALELNVARLQGFLKGDTPEERFQIFSKHLCQPEKALGLFAEYPVLARQLSVCIDNWL